MSPRVYEDTDLAGCCADTFLVACRAALMHRREPPARVVGELESAVRGLLVLGTPPPSRAPV